MHWKAEIRQPRHLRLVLEEEMHRNVTFQRDETAYALFIFEGDNDRCTWDYLHGTRDAAVQFAEDQFAVPASSWKGFGD